MQKKIIALAVAAVASGAAFAQTNVTVSGEMKTQLNQVSANGATSVGNAAMFSAGTITGLNATARSRIDNGTSKLTFAGSEDLGNGMKALFQIDSDVGSDRVSGSIFGNRETFVGIAGNWGAVLAGRLNAHYATMSGIEANGIANGLGLQTSSLNLFGATGLTNQGATGTARGTRLNNVIAYATPNMNGFSGVFAWVPGFGNAAGDENTAANLAAKERGWNLVAKYANGPINAAYSLYQVKSALSAAPTNAVAAATLDACLNNSTGAITMVPTTTCTGTVLAAAANAAIAATTGLGVDFTSHRFGFAYAFPMGLKVGFIFDRSEQETVGVANSDSKRTAWSLPMTYTMGAHNFYFTYGRANALSGNAWSSNGTAAGDLLVNTARESAYRMTMLAYSYDLSKRTQINASWTTLQNGQASSADFWHGNASVGGGFGAGADPTSFAVGLRHAF